MSDKEIADLFAEWDRGELNSFLIEITSKVLRTVDPETGEPLVEKILDTAGQKGTGKWTSEVAMDLGVPIPTIDSAVTMRQISARKAERVAAAKKYDMDNTATPMPDDFRTSSVQIVRDGLHAAFIATYAQGLSLLKAASHEKNFAFDMVEIAKIWRGGCIIRAALLEDIRKAFESEPGLENVLVSDQFVPDTRAKRSSLMMMTTIAQTYGIPCMSAAASLNYMVAYSSGRLPANLIQAQRDYFGAHTYQRIDREGIFHTPDWDAANQPT